MNTLFATYIHACELANQLSVVFQQTVTNNTSLLPAGCCGCWSTGGATVSTAGGWLQMAQLAPLHHCCCSGAAARAAVAVLPGGPCAVVGWQLVVYQCVPAVDGLEQSSACSWLPPVQLPDVARGTDTHATMRC